MLFFQGSRREEIRFEELLSFVLYRWDWESELRRALRVEEYGVILTEGRKKIGRFKRIGVPQTRNITEKSGTSILPSYLREF